MTLSTAKGALHGDDEAGRQVAALLERAGRTMDDVDAQTLVIRLSEVERLDRMIASTEARRRAALREIERHRAAFAARLRAASEIIEDGQFSEVEVESDPAAAMA